MKTTIEPGTIVLGMFVAVFSLVGLVLYVTHTPTVEVVSDDCDRLIRVAEGIAAQAEHVQKLADDYHREDDEEMREVLLSGYDTAWDVMGYTIDEFRTVEGRCER